MKNQKYSEDYAKVKTRIDVRMINVPPVTGDIVIKSIRDLQRAHINKLIITFGTVMRTSNVNSRELRKKFQCKQC